MTNRADSDQLASSDVHCLLRQGILCSKKRVKGFSKYSTLYLPYELGQTGFSNDDGSVFYTPFNIV